MNKIECKVCHHAMRLWAMAWRESKDPALEHVLLSTAKSFRDGPCFHEHKILVSQPQDIFCFKPGAGAHGFLIDHQSKITAL